MKSAAHNYAQISFILISLVPTNAFCTIKPFGSCRTMKPPLPTKHIPKPELHQLGFQQTSKGGQLTLPVQRKIRSSRTRLKLLPISCESFYAAAALIIASLVGTACDRKLLPSSGILVTLSLAAIMSNSMKIVPSTHILYDCCWSVMLPMSFSLLLVSMGSHEMYSKSHKTKTAILETRTIRKVGFSFLIASVGSVVGCLVSYKLCCLFPGLFLLNIIDAAQVTSCLAASFVGGSINFFATAASIPHLNRSLITAMAAADIVIMAVYFAGLSLALNAPSLKRLFASGRVNAGDTPAVDEARGNEMTAPSTSWRGTGLISLVALILSAVFTAAVKLVENFVSPIIPGTSYAVLAVLVPAFMKRLNVQCDAWFGQRLRQAAEPLSGVMFLSLFASIGMSIDLRSTLQSGPSCLIISLIALVCHLLVAVFGSWLFIKDCRLEDVLVASNAAIGGPATAAAFCGQCGAQYAFAGTLWGIVGYAVGTTLGTMMYRLLVP